MSTTIEKIRKQHEYFDYQERPKQIITEEILLECCEAVIKGMLK